MTLADGEKCRAFDNCLEKHNLSIMKEHVRKTVFGTQCIYYLPSLITDSTPVFVRVDMPAIRSSGRVNSGSRTSCLRPGICKSRALQKPLQGHFSPNSLSHNAVKV